MTPVVDRYGSDIYCSVRSHLPVPLSGFDVVSVSVFLDRHEGEVGRMGQQFLDTFVSVFPRPYSEREVGISVVSSDTTLLHLGPSETELILYLKL